MSLTSREITNALARTCFSVRRQIIVPNVGEGLGIWEADLAVLYPSLWLEEVEIKISCSDFRKEFKTKAAKHRQLVRGVPDFAWNKARRDFDEDFSKPLAHKTRRFWFAMPIELAQRLLPEVPAYCGLLGVGATSWGHTVHVLQQAPTLKMARKLTEEERGKLLRLGYLRYWDLRLRDKEAA